MVSRAAALSLVAAATAFIAVLASPLPSEEGRDANASAPSSFLNCANAVGQGNGFNNCTSNMPNMPSGMPSGMPEGWGNMPDGWGNMPSGQMPENRPQPPSVNQGVDCATAVGQGNGFNNCTNIFNPNRG